MDQPEQIKPKTAFQATVDLTQAEQCFVTALFALFLVIFKTDGILPALVILGCFAFIRYRNKKKEFEKK